MTEPEMTDKMEAESRANIGPAWGWLFLLVYASVATLLIWGLLTIAKQAFVAATMSGTL